ncbi:hypothetical protein Bca101_005639 [Brassica carinata]
MKYSHHQHMATTARLPERRNQPAWLYCSILQQRLSWLGRGGAPIPVVRRLKSKVVRILLRMRGRDLRQIVMCEMPFRPNITVKQLLIILALRIVPPSYTFIGYGSISHRLSGIFEQYWNRRGNRAQRKNIMKKLNAVLELLRQEHSQNSEVPIEIFFVVSEKIPAPIL